MLIPLRKLGLIGVISPDDFPSEDVPMGGMTNGLSVMFRGGYVRKAAGWFAQLTDFTEDQMWFQSWDTGEQVSTVFASASALRTTTDGVTSRAAVTLDQDGLPLTLGSTGKWQSEVFGSYAIMNNGIDIPLYSSGYDSDTDVWTFRSLPGWGKPNSPSGPVRVIREFKEHLIALGVSGSPFTVYWSSTPEPIIQLTVGTLNATLGQIVSTMGGTANNTYGGTLDAPLGRVVATMGGQVNLLGTLNGTIPVTSVMGGVTTPSGTLDATIGVISTMGGVQNQPYVQTRVANNAAPTRTYLQRSGAIYPAISSLMSLSCWVRFDSSGGHTVISSLNYGATPTQSALRLYRNSAGELRFIMLNSAGNGIPDDVIYNIGTALDGHWFHVLINVNWAGQVYNAWVDGVQRVTNAPFILTTGGGAYPTSELTRWTIMGNVAQSPASNSTAMNGAVGDVYVRFGALVTLADVWAAGNNPVDLGTDGAIPLNSRPTLFAGGNMTLTTGGVNNTGWNGTLSTVYPWVYTGAPSTPFTRGSNPFTLTT